MDRTYSKRYHHNASVGPMVVPTVAGIAYQDRVSTMPPRSEKNSGRGYARSAVHFEQRTKWAATNPEPSHYITVLGNDEIIIPKSESMRYP